MLAASALALRLPKGACRALCAAVDHLTATAIKCKNSGKTLEVEFNTGERFSLPAEYLRVESPAAGNRDALNPAGRLKIVHGRRHVGIIDIQPIGSYAIRISFDDLYNSGIYTWQYLHDLGTQKWRRMRSYLAELKHQRLSRDPPSLRKRRQLPPAEPRGASGTGGASSSSSGSGSSGSSKDGSGGGSSL